MRRLPYIALVLVLAGCYVRQQSSAGLDRRGSPQVFQSGSVETPASADVTTSQTTLVVPAGSVVTVPGDPSAGESQRVAPGRPSGWSVTLSKPSELRIATRHETVEGSVTPKPPPPPSPAEIAKGKGVRWFYFAGVASGIASLVAFWRRYPLGGVCCALGALAFPLAGNLASEKWAAVAGGICLVAAGVFFLAWKLISARHGLPKTV